MNSTKKAFSMIELSIVVLIISLLVAGVIGGKNLIQSSRISSAKSLTNSSPVTNMRGLTIWLESTSRSNFLIQDGDKVNSWNDINPTSTTKNNFTSSSSNRPTYDMRAINNLPGVKFDGDDDYLIDNFSLSGLVPLTNNFSIVIVAKFNEELANSNLIQGSNLTILSKNDSNQIAYYLNGSNSTVTSKNPSKAEIYELIYKNGTIRLYMNGALSKEESSYDVSENINGQWVIGSNELFNSKFMNGSISEIIIFDRAIKGRERISIEEYLSQKWSIDLEG